MKASHAAIFLCILFGANACCVPKICEENEVPVIRLQLPVNDSTGLSPEDVQSLQIFILNKSNNAIIDSLIYFDTALNLIKISCRAKRNITITSGTLIISCPNIVDTSLFSIDTSYYQPMVTIAKETLNSRLQRPIEEVKDYDYLLMARQANFVGRISEVKYDIESKQATCDDCSGSRRRTVTKINNFSYRLGNQLIMSKDTVVPVQK